MKFTPNRLLWLTVVASLAVHFVIYLALDWRHRPSIRPDAHGVVSVDFIEPVVHTGAARPIAPRIVRPRPARPKPTAAPGAPKEDVEPEASESTAGAASGPTVAVRGEPGVLNAFVGTVGRLIDARKTYPRAALRRELEGRVMVAITLASDGRLLRAEVESPCPFASLNEAALAAVRTVAAFPPLPEGFGPTLHLHVPIVFKIAR